MPKAKKLPSGNWRARAYIGIDSNGKKVYKSFTAETKAEAEFLASECIARGKQDRVSITIGDAVSAYIDNKENVLSPSTISGYRNIMRNRIEEVKATPICKFNSLAAQTYINRLAVKLSPKSVANAWGLIVAAVQLCDPDRHFTVTLPAKRKIIREIPTAPEVITAIRGSDIELPALLAMWLSLRMSEIRGLKYKDIVNDVLTVRRTMLTVDRETVIRDQTKTYGSTRRLKLPPYIVGLIGAGDPNEFIVKQSAEVIYKHFVAQIRAAGLPHMRFHDLRHLSASVMVSLGVPDKYSMERGGWTTTSTLQNVYQHTFSDDRKAVDNLIDNYFADLLG